MKKTKLFALVLVLLVFSSVLNAANPSKDKTSNKNVLVEKLSKDIALTEGQKVRIEVKANVFTEKMKNANTLLNRQEMLSAKMVIRKDYQMALDSILTQEQKEQLSTKKNERNEANKKEFKSN